MLETGRSLFRFPKKILDYSFDLTLPVAYCPGVDQPLTEINNRNLPRVKGWPARKSDLTDISEPNV
jgi:hypothetical protein